MPQSTETTRVIPILPVELSDVEQALIDGDIPNPCYMLWDGVCFIRVSYDVAISTQIQVCGDPDQQDASSCNPYVCESTKIEDDLKIERSFKCGTDIDVETRLFDGGLSNIGIVNNSEDWFPRLQYYFQL